MTAENNHYLSRISHLRLPKVCVAVTGADANDLLDKAEAVVRDNPFIELRLDHLARPGLALPRIKEFTETHPHVAVIATCRRTASGGKFRGSIPSQLEVLGKAAEAGCQLVDIEIQAAVRLKPAQVQKLRAKAAVVLSFHDFRATQKLEETLKKMAAYPADFYKIVGTAASLYDQVDAATKVYGVAGDPIEHSLSPAIMNAALRRENVNGVFLALHAKSLKDLLSCVRDIPIHGLAITMPHKQAILQHLDNTDPFTEKIGACNTVVRSADGKLYGFNTDTSGVVRPLEQRITLTGAKVLVLGAGGAARAAVFGLKDRGAQVFVLNRNLAAAQKLARQARARTVKRPDLKRLEFDVIINATPVGMGNPRESPLNAEEIKAKYVFDMVYDPAETKLLTLAKERGAEVIPGSEMFVHQAARQFEIWTGKPAPREDMLRIVTQALEQRAAARNAGNEK